MTTTIKFTTEELGAIVADHIRQQGYQPVGEVSIGVGQRLEGYGNGEHNVIYCKGATIEVEAKPVRRSSSSLGSQIADVEAGRVTEG